MKFLNISLSLIAGFLGAYLFNLIPQKNQVSDDKLPISSYVNVAQNSSLRAAAEHTLDFTLASSVSTPSVVYIKTIATTETQRYSWFDLFFNGQNVNQEQVIGSGSGVIFTQDGYIVTNNHVIHNSDKIEVVLGKRTYSAKLIGTDPSTDLAVLKIEANGLMPVRISPSYQVKVGDWVLAVGNPFNLTSTVTCGIVSAKGRRINVLEDVFPIESFIQTDAAINPGNSGGALVNTKGELVGINTAILSKTGSYSGYGFAVPSDIVVKVFEDIKKYGEVQKAFVGADVVDVDENISKKFNLSKISGVILTNIGQDGAAEKAGLKQGDVIVKINQTNIDSKSDFDEQISFRAPGEKIQLQIIREQNIIDKELILTNIDGTTGIIKREIYNAKSLGAVFEEVPKLERSRLGINNGVRIKKIDAGLISRMGLPEGVIILEINNYKINTPSELSEILEKIRGRVIVLVALKDGTKRYITYYF